jgi:protein-S-isoprenylcysteine O-methyltransferase Ste14
MTTTTAPGSVRPGAIPWPPILLLAAIVGSTALGRMAPLGWPGLGDAPARLVGLGFGLAGVAILVWAALTLRRHRTTILPHRGASSLVTDGPYRWRRHPIYVGDMFVLFGIAEMTRNVWFVVAAFTFAGLVWLLQIRPEERHLEAVFGDEWRAYAARTRTFL